MKYKYQYLSLFNVGHKICHFLATVIQVNYQRQNHNVVLSDLPSWYQFSVFPNQHNNHRSNLQLTCYSCTRWVSSVSVKLCFDPYRIGPREKYFHCEKCNLCLAQDLRGNHKVIFTLHLFLTHTHRKYCFWWANERPRCCDLQLFLMFQCVENVSRQNCPVCMEVIKHVTHYGERCWIFVQAFTFSTIWYGFLLHVQDIHTSRIGAHVLPCGHLLHKYDSVYSSVLVAQGCVFFCLYVSQL